MIFPVLVCGERWSQFGFADKPTKYTKGFLPLKFPITNKLFLSFLFWPGLRPW